MWETLTDHLEVIWGAVAACGIVILLTPAVGGMARMLGVVDQPGARRLNRRAVPRLGGLALFFGIFVPALAFLPLGRETKGLLLGAAVATLVGADRRLPRPRLVAEARRPDHRRRDPGRLRDLGAPLHVPGARRCTPCRSGSGSR